MQVEHAVIIATKNRINLLKRSIQSVYDQDVETWRLIIVNDGSEDETREYLDRLRESDSRVIIIHSEVSRGMQASQNKGFDHVESHEYVSLLDDDDYFLPGAFKKMSEKIVEDSGEHRIIFFNTNRVTQEGIFEQGIAFKECETWFDPTYYEVVTKAGLTGDCHMVIHGSLVTGPNAYRYSEDINGFPYELLIKFARDRVGIRYFNVVVKNMDRLSTTGHLSSYGSRKSAPFVSAYVRIFREHRQFFLQHPDAYMRHALRATKVALRAHMPLYALWFGGRYVESSLRCVVFKDGK